ncbi:hypothetical protein [Agriterribacter humi]|uniref:hypothetical protein n=1 Tax=Agriterribacter humi TaxID=1104781 RepID=UPI0012644B45|nr:hypothetical protein [Agriterribacter humi]
MEEGLKIRVGADLSEVDKGFDTLISKAKELGKSVGSSISTSGIDKLSESLETASENAQDIAADLSKIGGKSVKPIIVDVDTHAAEKAVDDLEKDIDKLGRKAPRSTGVGGFDDFTQKIKGIKKPTNDATRSLVDLSRIAQDAPFGFIGIANNINPALESFQRLKTESGSTGKALKSLVLGLAGPAGIGVAFSVISSALVVAVQKYGSVSNAIKALTGDLSAAQRVLNDFNKAFATSGGNALAEKSNLESLVSIARNAALSTEARKNAIEEINNKYPLYLKNLNLETLNTNETSIAIGKQIKLLDLRAKQEAISTVLKKKYVELIENETKSVDEQLGVWDQIVVTAKKQFNISDGLVDAAVRGTKNYKKQNDELNRGVGILKKQQDAVNTAIAEIGGFTVQPDKTKRAASEAAKQIEKAFKLIAPEIEIPVSFGGKQIFSESVKEMYDAFKNFKTYFEQKDDLKIEVPLTIDKSKPIIPPEHIQQAITQMQAMQSELDAMALFVGGPLSETFAGLFRTIATDGKLSMKQVGQAAKQLVTDLIAAAVKAAVLAVIFKAFGGKAGAVGSFGSLFKGLLTGGSKMATGGIVPPGFENDTFPARLSSREAVIPLDRLESMIGGRREGSGEMVARLRGAGPDLILFLERQKRSQNRSF